MLKRLFAACVGTSIATLASLSASAGDVCIDPKIEQSLSSCAGVDLKPPANKHSPVAVTPVKPPAAKAAPTKAPEPDPKLAAVEIRRGLTGRQRRELLVTQIQHLESLLAATAAGAPDRPGILRRLADSYVELEAVTFRAKVEAQTKGNKDEAAKLASVEGAARQTAIKYYSQLRQNHPAWCQSPGQGPSPASGCLDETLYNLAYEHEQAGDLAAARKAYLDLIQSAPSSKYVPHAYLAFGELFFQEAQSDPSKWPLAEQSYKEVIKYPAPENKVLSYAHYKLAYVYWNKGDFAAALGELKRTVDIGLKYPKLPNAEPLAVSARRDLVPLYALTGDPKKAHDFYRPLSGDGAAESERTFRWLADLGQNYLDIGHYQEGIELYRDLLKRDRGARSCGYQARITEAVLAQKTGDKAAAKAEIDRQLAVERAFRKEAHSDQDKLACANATAALATETAMIWHLEVVGSGGVPGTGSPETTALAADLYDSIVKQFTAAEFARFEFPRLVKEDWPTLLKVKSARADLLYAKKDWASCGAAFDAVVAEDPRGPLAAESALASALCYQNAYLAAHQNHADRASLDASKIQRPRELDERERAMLASFDRYVCIVKPAAGDKAAQGTLVEVKFARARTYFEGHRWPESAAAFRGVALEHPDHETGIYAAQLYLEVLNVMASHGTPACFDTMAQDVPKLTETYCGGARGKTNAEQCGTLAKIERDLEWKRLDLASQRIGTSTGPERAKEWEEIANGYLRIWNRWGKEACEGKQPTCDRMDDVLTNAARAFQAARLLAKAIAVRKLLLDPKYNLERTARAKQAVRDLGANYQAIAVYDEAAGWYERFASESPGLDGASQALQDAIVMRLGLGQEEQAEKDAALFERNYRQRHPALAAQIAFALATHAAEHDDWVKADKRLSPQALSEIDQRGTLDVQIQAHALRGRVLRRTVGDSAAAPEFAKVRALYGNPEAALAKLDAIGGDEGAKGRRIAKVVTAVGEAIFFSAEQKQRAADALHFPAYKGSGRREDVLAHINGKVADWMKKKQPAIEEASREYQKILEIKPEAPPRWVIAAGARVGQMWGKFVAEFRAAPVPKEWQKTGPSPYGDLTWEEIRLAYVGAIDDASEPWRRRAKDAYKTCLSYSTRYQYFDESSRSCEKWLSKNYGAEFHAVDELRGAPAYLGSRVEGQPITLESAAR
jgi:TolA-binding protein